MKPDRNFLKLIYLAKIARKKVERLSALEGGPICLMGYCGIASLYLESMAKNNNIYTNFIVGQFRSYRRPLDSYRLLSGHVWLEYEDNIIDLTVTQFKNATSKIRRDFGKKVYVCKSNNPHYLKVDAGDGAKKIVETWHYEPFEELLEKVSAIDS